MKRTINEQEPLHSEFQAFSSSLRQRIIELRHQRGLTQEDMQQFGLSLRQYQRIESGETENITLANLYRIASGFGLSVSELLACLVLI
ncbi:helix-turn-helix transcriptional regulator [Porticoccus sp. W117]|uniref:helix-turn-helix domain-containing protein n=1 Tax=Porticoccus sp. W117 TaxID=3054777 RepID=UPI002599E2DC|nr:helix-turn-helix transcriptional regulator [Porticoccus sp. W117]MDM3872535.1 helix-turn-helix transcriptional regulator [Porticoccus sp. W117]